MTFIDYGLLTILTLLLIGYLLYMLTRYPRAKACEIKTVSRAVYIVFSVVSVVGMVYHLNRITDHDIALEITFCSTVVMAMFLLWRVTWGVNRTAE